MKLVEKHFANGKVRRAIEHLENKNSTMIQKIEKLGISWASAISKMMKI
jgi:hypothetical protein